MSSGLKIHTKKRGVSTPIVLCALAAVLLVIGMLYGYRWYVRGDVPPMPILASAVTKEPIKEIAPISATEKEAHTVQGQEPRYISIPSLGTDQSRILQVDLTENNDLTLPRLIDDAGWYKDSAKPGQGYGVVVLNGRQTTGAAEGLFTHIKDLAIGDEINIERGDGEIIIYKVEEARTLTLEELRTGNADLMKPYDTAKEGLNIVVYAGNWIPRDQTYESRVLIRAVHTL